MSRKKSIDTSDLIRLLDEYRIDNPGVKITIPKFGTYVRNKGYNVQDHTIRRYKEFRDYLDAVNKGTECDVINDLVTYKTIDAEAFLAKNNTKDKLKAAITSRDQYYANIAARAAESIQARIAAEERIQELESRIAELEKNLTRMQARADNSEIRKKSEAISKLRAILSSYIYPDAANAILKKAGLLEVTNSLVPDELVEAKTIHADTDITDKKGSKYESINKLVGGFDD